MFQFKSLKRKSFSCLFFLTRHKLTLFSKSSSYIWTDCNLEVVSHTNYIFTLCRSENLHLHSFFNPCLLKKATFQSPAGLSKIKSNDFFIWTIEWMYFFFFSLYFLKKKEKKNHSRLELFEWDSKCSLFCPSKQRI